MNVSPITEVLTFSHPKLSGAMPPEWSARNEPSFKDGGAESTPRRFHVASDRTPSNRMNHGVTQGRIDGIGLIKVRCSSIFGEPGGPRDLAGVK